MDLRSLTFESFEVYPYGVVFSKAAPPGDRPLNYDVDFRYVYFSPGLEIRCSLKREKMLDGKTTAKLEFENYEQIFEDDLKVLREYKDGKVLAFVEPWLPNGRKTQVYARKTSLDRAGGDSYMLGTFEILDDLTLGISRYRRMAYSTQITSNAVLPPSDWFLDAWNGFPNALALAALDGTLLTVNDQWKAITSLVTADDERDLNFTKDVRDIISLFEAAEDGWNAEMLSSSTSMLTQKVKNPDHQLYDIGIYGIRGGNVITILLRESFRSIVPSFSLPY